MFTKDGFQFHNMVEKHYSSETENVYITLNQELNGDQKTS